MTRINQPKPHARQNPEVATSLHRLFEQQVRRTPDLIAVKFKEVELSYAELDAKCNGLARHFKETYEIQRGDLIGVVMDKSQYLVPAILAVLKAGCGYVPMDPRLPPTVLDEMISRVQPKMVIVTSNGPNYPLSHSGHVCIIDVEERGLRGNATTFEPDDCQNIAYVIFTSGSTGSHKAVAVTHAAISNTVQWRNSYYGMSVSDVTLQIPSCSFDSSVVDIFCSLTTGGKLVLPEAFKRLDGRYIAQLIKDNDVTRLLLTPSYYLALVKSLAATTSLVSITVAGERISKALVESHFKLLPTVRLVNEYGPTENAVCSTACDLCDADRQITIGRPIPNVGVIIADEQLRAVPSGIEGEICLWGKGLAIGYLNQSQLTAERFVTTLISGAPVRMYRTGDRGRMLLDGTIEYLGRNDLQVKLHGHRIELGHIEHILSKHSAVCNIAVVLKENSTEQYLAAYCSVDCTIAGTDLLKWAQIRLPPFMVPRAVIVLDALPLNGSGKIDREALVARDDAAVVNRNERARGTDLEMRLLAITSAVLERPELSLTDNFLATFAASSLMVMGLVARIRSEIEAGIELQDVYLFPTVRGIASCIERLRGTAHL